jgi:hypothetical protein
MQPTCIVRLFSFYHNSLLVVLRLDVLCLDKHNMERSPFFLPLVPLVRLEKTVPSEPTCL